MPNVRNTNDIIILVCI